MNPPGTRTRLFVISLCFLAAAMLVAAEADKPKAPAESHTEALVIGRDAKTRFGRLSTLRLDGDGNLLACDAAKKHIRVISPAGKTLATWPLKLAPDAMWRCADGTIYVAGSGKIAKLNKDGKVLKTVDLPSVDAKATTKPARGRGRGRRGRSKPPKPSGITVMKNDVFVAIGVSWSLRSRSTIVRLTRDLTAPKIIARDLRGCCQRLDMTAKDGVLYVAENARHRVVKYDRDGKVLGKWGRRERTEITGFGSCCNPMNLCFGPDGMLYTAESGLGRIKVYSPDGKFLSLVGYVGVARFQRAGQLAASCSNIAIAVSADGARVYVQDVKNNLIRVLEVKVDAKASTQPTTRNTEKKK